MAKDVKFKIRLSVDGREQVVQVSTDVKKLARVVDNARSSTSALRDGLLRATQVGVSIQNVVGGLRQLTGVLGQYTAAARVQEEVEAKLANNMRNTMGASDAEVKSILKLAAAQQALGVIGDEVQLAGAQELATYLEKKSSLEALLPVMNDMLAQQYGLNATQESAANIATMLGKVMDGQVGALSRYGYKFDEAQEKVLKYGTESERAAVLADVVSSAVGGMNAALAKTDAGKAKQLANTMGDLKEQVGQLAAAYEPAIAVAGELGMTVAGIGTAVSGVAGVVKAIKGLEIGTKLAAGSQRMLAVQLRLTAAAEVNAAAGSKALAVGQRALAAACGVAKVALRGLLVATGVGAALAALGFVVEKLAGHFDKAGNEAKELAEGEDAVKRASVEAAAGIETQKAKLEGLMAAQKAGKDVSKEERAIIEELNGAYGSRMGYFESVQDWYAALTANSKAYCRQLEIEARMQMLAQANAVSEQKRRDIARNPDGSQRQYSNKRDKVRYDSKSGGIEFDPNGIVGSSDREKAQAAYDKETAAINERRKEMAALNAESAKLEMVVRGSSTPPPLRVTPSKIGGGVGTATTTETENPGPTEAYSEAVAEAGKETDQFREKLRDEVGTYRELEERLAAWNALLLDADEGERARITAEIRKLEEKRDEWERLAEGGDGRSAAERDREMKRDKAGKANERAQRVQQDYEIGIIGKDKALEELEEINKELRELGLKPVRIDVETDGVDDAKKKMKAATDAVGQMGQSLGQLGSAMGAPELNVAGTIAQAVATMTQAYATATAGAAKMGPWAWVAFAAAGFAQLAALISSVKSVNTFAEGGLAYGPTLGLFGEYGGASHNPEVVAPLDKLRGMLQPTAVVVGGRIEVSGRKLAVLLEHERGLAAKSGRRL